MNTLQAPPKRRNRAPKPAWSFEGMTAEQWRANSELVRWAQNEPRFKDLLTVLNNEARAIATNLTPGLSEGLHLGAGRGAFRLFEQALSLATGITPPLGQLGDPDYPADNQ